MLRCNGNAQAARAMHVGVHRVVRCSVPKALPLPAFVLCDLVFLHLPEHRYLLFCLLSESKVHCFAQAQTYRQSLQLQ